MGGKEFGLLLFLAVVLIRSDVNIRTGCGETGHVASPNIVHTRAQGHTS